MLLWSRYNTLFHSDRFGYFLYNAISNSFFKLNKTYFRFLEQIKSNSHVSVAEINHQFHNLLIDKKILVKEGEEKKILQKKHYQRNLISFDSSRLDLSLCPTLMCNFRCPYCFEHSQQISTVMNKDTINRLISFIEKQNSANRLYITWYGGEPTLVFNVIQEITKKVKELDITFEGAGLVTNAYLLNKSKIDKLNDLKITNIQITIDGPECLHDSRRVLANGKPTYQKIMNNIEELMGSSYEGSCNIRVNLDKNNLSGFFDLRADLTERFKGKKFSVYGGLVDTSPSHKYDHSCNLCAKEWKEFTIAQYRHLSDSPSEGIYPINNVFNICSANSINSFVIGPEGEIYKCWEDVGKHEMIVGSIFKDESIANSDLVSLYSIGTDPFLEPTCLDCKVLPICGGGCSNRRLRVKFFHEESLEFCSLYKDNLTEYLLEYYDTLLTKELCGDILNANEIQNNESGYKILHPGSEN
ncbi:MAG TPA: SPASM domain-containing protein [candidate division Zixibacteria bacterium]|nr:SPASM domain-containing protein [candidate division Zixibacteria bacterium]